LENGDRLTRDEFERRYHAMPHVKKAELIEGAVHMPSPVSTLRHGSPNLVLNGWLFVYWSNTRGVRGADNATIRLDLGNEPQPDSFLLIEPECGGRARYSPEGYVEGAPEFVGEISASSVSIDLNVKLRAYERNGVQEYVVWRVLEQAIDWFVLRNGQFERLAPDSAGILKSEVFPGLWLDAPAMLRGDLATVLAVLQQGIADPAHAAFVAKLQK
jgi:hypothetical protein